MRHLAAHSGASFRCGVENCPSQYTNLRSFRAHLASNHEDIYPSITSELPELINSIFKYPVQTNFVPQEIAPIQIEVPDFDPASPVQSPDLIDHDQAALEHNLRGFADILVRQGCSHSVPFQHLQGISKSMITFFRNVSRTNGFSDDLELELQHLIRTQESFNGYIQNNFRALFHEMINISNTDQSFAFFPFKKSLFKLLSLYSSFDELFTGSSNTEDSLTSMPCTADGDNSIMINIFIDDFQLCNPLLSKQTQHNSMTGIYYRIVSSNKLNF